MYVLGCLSDYVCNSLCLCVSVCLCDYVCKYFCFVCDSSLCLAPIALASVFDVTLCGSFVLKCSVESLFC